MLSRLVVTTMLTTVLFASCTVFKKAAAPDYSTSIYVNSLQSDSSGVATTTTKMRVDSLSRADSVLKNKYSSYLKLPADSIKDLRLYRFIDHWLYTPYLWGGTSKRGIDCSAFMQKLLSEVYRLKIPRTSIQQFYTDNVEPFGSWKYLAEGDLVFFKTMPGNPITHVGMYLGNNMFINASSSKGVSFASLKDPYWATKYVAAGRLIVRKSQRINN